MLLPKKSVFFRVNLELFQDQQNMFYIWSALGIYTTNEWSMKCSYLGPLREHLMGKERIIDILLWKHI